MSSRGSYEVSKYLSILDATAPGLGLSAFEDDMSGRGRRRGRKRSMSSSSDSVGKQVPLRVVIEDEMDQVQDVGTFSRADHRNVSYRIAGSQLRVTLVWCRCR